MTLSPGKHTITWDATDSLNTKVPRGYYILKLQSGELRQTGIIGRR